MGTTKPTKIDPVAVAVRPAVGDDAGVGELDARLGELKQQLLEVLERNGGDESSIDPDAVTHAVREFAQLVNGLLPASLPAEAADEARRVVIDALVELEGLDAPGALAALDRLLLRIEQVRELMRERDDEGLGEVEEDGPTLLALLAEWLPGITQADLALLAGTSARTLQRLASAGGPPPNRLRLVARLVAELRHAWTPAGVIAWFGRPRIELDGRPPVDVLDDPVYEGRLRRAVREGASGHGS
jgi:hypothetical protein